MVTEWTKRIITMVEKGHSRDAIATILQRYPGLPRTSAANILELIMEEHHRRRACDGKLEERPDDQ